jgi:hypothetical protein
MQNGQRKRPPPLLLSDGRQDKPLFGGWKRLEPFSATVLLQGIRIEV